MKTFIVCQCKIALTFCILSVLPVLYAYHHALPICFKYNEAKGCKISFKYCFVVTFLIIKNVEKNDKTQETRQG